MLSFEDDCRRAEGSDLDLALARPTRRSRWLGITLLLLIVAVAGCCGMLGWSLHQ